jgi:hypothetical protein
MDPGNFDCCNIVDTAQTSLALVGLPRL